MQDLYTNREQSEAKHGILRQYLTPFAHKIISQWGSIDFIDGFSGPWDNRDTERLTDTSIGISLATLSDVAESLGHTPQKRCIRCIFNEEKSRSYEQLVSYLEAHAGDFPLIKIETLHGKFESNAAEIKRRANHRFQLLFVDPTGYTGFPPSALHLFRGRSTEIIVNFMRSFIERFVSGNHEDRIKGLIGLVGEKRARFLLDTGLSIETLEAEYLSMLRGDLGYRFAALSPVHNPDKDEIHFKLAFATNHSAGMEVLRSAEFGVLSDYDRKRFQKSKGSEPDLFTPIFDEMAIEGPYLKARKAHFEDAPNVMIAELKKHWKGMPFADLAASVQQRLYLRQTELKDVVVSLTRDGVIKADWKSSPKQQKPSSDSQILLT